MQKTGRRLGTFRFLSSKLTLKIGSFGVVYKAVHKLTQEKRAIKFIDRSAVSAEEEAKLLQEIEILRQLVLTFVFLCYELFFLLQREKKI